MLQVNFKEMFQSTKNKITELKHRQNEGAAVDSQSDNQRMPVVQVVQGDNSAQMQYPNLNPRRNGNGKDRWDSSNQDGSSGFGGRVPYQPAQFMPNQPAQPQQPVQPMPESQVAQQQAQPQMIQEQPARSMAPNEGFFTRVMAVMSFDQCGALIEQMRADQELLITMECMQDRDLVQRCTDTLAGAAFAMNVDFHRISLGLPIYLITSKRVQYYIDPIFIQNLQQQLYRKGYVQTMDVLRQYNRQQPSMQAYSQPEQQPPVQAYPQPGQRGYQNTVDYMQVNPQQGHGYQQQGQQPVQPYPQPVPQNRGRVQVRSTQADRMKAMEYGQSNYGYVGNNAASEPIYNSIYGTNGMSVPGSKTDRFRNNANQPSGIAEVVNGFRSK